MTDIVELIDCAVQDWETSRDAMRWSPESKIDPVASLALTDEQAPYVAPGVEQAARSARNSFATLSAAFAPVVKVIGRFLSPLLPTPPERTQLRRMRSAYHRRAKARARRNRA